MDDAHNSRSNHPADTLAESDRSLEAPQPVPPRRRGWITVAHATAVWLVIIGLTGRLMWEGNRPDPNRSSQAAQKGNAQAELTGKLVIGLSRLAPSSNELLLSQAASLKDGPIRVQLQHAVLVAELEGPDAGLKAIDEIGSAKASVDPAATQATQPSESEQRVITILRRIFEAHVNQEDAVLMGDERALLEDQLGWFGKIAPLTSGTSELSARQQAFGSLKTMTGATIAAGLWYTGCGIVGLTVLIALLVLAIRRRLKHGFAPSGRGLIYAETFAAWLFLWFGMRELAHMFVPRGAALALTMIVSIVSLIVLGWPVIRGIRWNVVRSDVGLVLPRRPFAEIAIGLLTYCMALPFLLLGTLVTGGLILVQRHFSPDAEPPSHPVQEMIVGASWSTIIQIMILASIVAPFCEEIMFRGVLYRHMRETSQRCGLVPSIIISALVSSFIFAAIHPQGWVFIPVLGGLATGFCLAREWRGSLMASMIAHGTTNFITIALNIALFGAK